jgi:hypothetical protein
MGWLVLTVRLVGTDRQSQLFASRIKYLLALTEGFPSRGSSSGKFPHKADSELGRYPGMSNAIHFLI